VSAALQARIGSLLAERYGPVPRASHVIAVDVDHLALLMHYAAAVARQGRRAEPMTGDTRQTRTEKPSMTETTTAAPAAGPADGRPGRPPVNMLVILTAQFPGGITAQMKDTVNFNAGATRTQVCNWALGEAGLDRLRAGEYVVTFFYAEPDEIEVTA
jgi:hypothetical protein